MQSSHGTPKPAIARPSCSAFCRTMRRAKSASWQFPARISSYTREPPAARTAILWKMTQPSSAPTRIVHVQRSQGGKDADGQRVATMTTPYVPAGMDGYLNQTDPVPPSRHTRSGSSIHSKRSQNRPSKVSSVRVHMVNASKPRMIRKAPSCVLDAAQHASAKRLRTYEVSMSPRPRLHRSHLVFPQSSRR